ncbi:alpha/beta hydrolase [Sphingomonas sp. LY54]|uniref:alpha/beta hydrolase n=1 Tax=Sphingomonadales TaxID=204457 RepID=UPI002ADEB590|nr:MULTISPECIES: alpha/beta hydrolase [Sphingomonadales]MEA1015262.1 alpha/beta hydrolase [Sphingosinicella sp. LY1275]WRP27709.1 alpha/beta hydrolase [Sphingomonas sp. LY54]
MDKLEHIISDIRGVFDTLGEHTSLDEMRQKLDRLFGSGVRDDSIRHDSVEFGRSGGELMAADASPEGAPTVLYLHGGGYAVCSIESHRDLCERLAKAVEGRVLAVDYRLAPENPYPAALDDALAGYEWLLREGYPAGSIAIAGDSAGGGLAVATALAIKERGLPLPGCVAVMSPWVDLELKGASMDERADVDPIVERAALENWVACYTPTADVTNPFISPLHGDFSGFPPLLVQVGGREALYDDATRLVERAKQAGVDAKLQSFPEQIHVFQIFGYRLEAARAAISDLGDFIRERVVA